VIRQSIDCITSDIRVAGSLSAFPRRGSFLDRALMPTAETRSTLRRARLIGNGFPDGSQSAAADKFDNKATSKN
jgi:hypothetical protein